MAYQITYNERHLLPDESAIGIFNHIYKCGGSSLNKNFITSGISYGNLYCWDILSFYEKFLGKQVYASHEIGGIHCLLKDSDRYFYFSFIRNPYELALSFYKYLKVYLKNNPSVKSDVESNINKFLYTYRPNMLIRLLGGGDKHLAEENLLYRYVFFGIVEEYNLSLRTLNKIFPKLSTDASIKTNVTNDSNVYDIDPLAIEYFHEKNRDDFELYEKAYAEFKRRYADSKLQQTLHAEEISSKKDRGVTAAKLLASFKKFVNVTNPDTISCNEIDSYFNNHKMIEDMSALYAWLNKSLDKRAGFVYWAFRCADRLGYNDDLRLLGKRLFRHCSKLDPQNVMLGLKDLRLEVLEKLLGKHLLAGDSVFRAEYETWLHTLADTHPWQADALRMLAKLSAAQGGWQEAADFLWRAVAFKPDDDAVREDLCGALLQQGEAGIQKAETSAEAALTGDSAPEWALCWKARAAFAHAEGKTGLSAAEAAVEAALKKNPYWREGWRIKTAILEQTSPEKAVEAARAVRDLYPDEPEWAEALCQMLSRLGRDRDILAAGELSLTTNPHWGWMYMLLSRAHERLGEEEQALEKARLAVKADPAAAAHHMHLASLLVRMKKLDVAKRSAEEAHSAFPQEAWPEAQLALAFEAEGNFARACEEAEKALHKQPYKRSWAGLYAHMLRAAGRSSECEAFCRDRLAGDSSLAWAWRELCRCAADAGNLDAAQEYGARALECDPGDEDFRQYYHSLVKD